MLSQKYNQPSWPTIFFLKIQSSFNNSKSSSLKIHSGRSFYRTPFALRCFVPNLVEISLVVQKRKLNSENFTDERTNRRTLDKLQSETPTYGFSLHQLNENGNKNNFSFNCRCSCWVVGIVDSF